MENQNKYWSTLSIRRLTMVLTRSAKSAEVRNGTDMLNTENDTAAQLIETNVFQKSESNLEQTNVGKRKIDQVDGASTSEDFTDCLIFKKSKKSHRETYIPLAVSDNMVYEDLDYVYKMDTPVRGKVVIINMEHFGKKTRMSKRKGTEKDSKAIIKLFRELSFEVDCHTDVKKHEVIHALTEASRYSKEYSCFVCVILSHGEDGIIYAYDGALEIKEMAAIFENSSWIGKPKIFLIQACQGFEYMDGVKSPDCLDGNHGNDICISLPRKVDFLFAYSTVPGFYSWRNTSEGSWFMQCLVEEFRKYAHKLDVLRMFTRVNAMLSLRKSYTDEVETNHKRQTAYIVSLLRKDIYFFPPNGQLNQIQYN